MNYRDNLTKPVLFLVFNRPDKTKQVFEAIRESRPKKLYIAADAPRYNVPEDVYKCEKVREIVSSIDWECDAKYLFHEKNLGCSLAGVKAWDWIFSFEKEMIFLEDDGIPSKSFFWFCQELLDKYEHNHRIAHICGQNFGRKVGRHTYFFTRYAGATWGFATWKRTHDLFDYSLKSFNQTYRQKSFRKRFVTRFEYKYMIKLFANYIKKGGNTYDLQHSYLLYKYDWLDIMPNINLVTNIGYDSEATNNTVSKNSKTARKFGNLQRYEIEHISHPEFIEVKIENEIKQLMHRVFQDKTMLNVLINIYFPIFKKVQKIIKKLC